MHLREPFELRNRQREDFESNPAPETNGRVRGSTVAALSAIPLLGILVLAISCGHDATFQQRPTRGDRPVVSGPPAPMREFRAAWIATVANIDWPSRPGLPAGEQQKELIALLDMAANLKLNAVILQVRPACDALYLSNLEPWSEYLTGQMGRSPSPLWDPLAFAVGEAHRRGLELHAWFNPFRARHQSAKSPVSPQHISRKHPEWARPYGRYLWLDPGEKGVQEHVQTVVLDVLRRYDIDAVHLDDYFYPYKQANAAGKKLDFPDEKTWNRYRASGGSLSRADWRRKNVDDFVQTLYRRIKSEKPWVKFGISPFGIWRPGNPPQITGADAYEEIYADSRKWLREGWIDYIAPQLYWSIQSTGQSYPLLLQWWSDQNVKGRHLWPGISSANLNNLGWPASEIANQLLLTRQHSGASGNIFWNSSSLRKRNDLTQILKQEIYTQSALVPGSPWLDSQPPYSPIVAVERTSALPDRVRWEPSGNESAWLWLVQWRAGKTWHTQIYPRHVRSVPVPQSSTGEAIHAVAISAVDRAGNTSRAAMVELRPAPRWPVVGSK